MIKILYSIVLLFFYGICFAQNDYELPEVTSVIWNKKNDIRIKTTYDFNKLTKEEIKFKGGIIIRDANNKTGSNLFGGLSAIKVSENGKYLTTISDYSSVYKPSDFNKYRSRLFKFNITYDDSNFIEKAELKAVSNLKDSLGVIINGGIESVATVNNAFYFSRDNSKELFVFNRSLDKAIKTIQFNKSNVDIEALTNTSDGNLLAIEQGTTPGERKVWVINPIKQSFESKKYKSKYKEVKGATTLKNGDIIVLEKSYDSVKGTALGLSLVKERKLTKKILVSKPILNVDYTKILDNFEGITSYCSNGKEYILIISDDNGDWKDNNGQRTLLLHFELNL
ncbi:esterase-like activity of phytase family protein [Seonamhaeicola marinus]|uniref:Esterase-like activity of phytase family protein n=1 Tax=Seonamhaeicola marinus TaxID=1912246 RepID=A0A5D0HLA8_9FLAO|nr:esterase-like activity of phytase family protein [Seonamhaeicola marinus]TYA71760.1 esterase-like activity of phytase family protein [Seonamhaeicola marinus]